MDRTRRLRAARPQARHERGWYRIRNAADTSNDTAEVYIYDEIGWFGTSAADFVRDLVQIDADRIDLHVNSPGGDVFDSIAIFQALRNHRATVTSYVDSLAASGASIIALAGDRRLISPYGTMMIHEAWGIAIGGAADLRKYAEDLDRSSDSIAALYADRAGGDLADWREAMRVETWYNAAESVQAGLMHEQQPDTADDSAAASASNAWDLSVFNYAGREHAPPPRLRRPRAARPPGPADIDVPTVTGHDGDLLVLPWPARSAGTFTVSANPAGRNTATVSAPPASPDAPESPAEPPDPDPTTEPTEDDVSDLRDIARGLGLDEDAGKEQILAAIEAARPAEPEPTTPDPAPTPGEPDVTQPNPAPTPAEPTPQEPAADGASEYAAELARLSAELADIKAERAAATKKALFDQAVKDGKLAPADRGTWEARYDKAPEVITDVLASIAAGAAVPVAQAGYTGGDEPDTDAEFDALIARLDGPATTTSKGA